MELAAFACSPAHSRGRLFPENPAAMRDCFQRDRDRIIHSAAFRRLKYKTQVFVNHEGDHYRTRLTHSLEVSQITRTLARALRVNEDLAEGMALAHDLGHTPFGHAGEDALHEKMQDYGGFDHNEQTLRLLTDLESHYAKFKGLNLSWEMLEGLVKHNGALLPASPNRKKPIPAYILEFNAQWDLELHTQPSLEAQLASLADDIAYTCHDIEDGLRAGLLHVEDFNALPALAALFQQTISKYPNATPSQHIYESIRALMGILISDLLSTTAENLATLQPESPDAIRLSGNPTAAFSPPIAAMLLDTKVFLMARVYRHYTVNRMTQRAHRVVQGLFDFFMDAPDCLPPEWQPAHFEDKTLTARHIANYIAGMTDRYALKEYHKLLGDVTP